MRNSKDVKKKINVQVIGRQIAFATSSGMMMVFCILIGYFIGNQFCEIGSIIGIVLGSILGTFLFIGDLYAFIRIDERNKKIKEQKEKDNEK